MNRCIPIDLPDHIQQFLLRNIFRQMELPHLHANLTAPGDDPLFIRNVILPRADPHHSQCGHDTLSFSAAQRAAFASFMAATTGAPFKI